MKKISATRLIITKESKRSRQRTNCQPQRRPRTCHFGIPIGPIGRRYADAPGLMQPEPISQRSEGSDRDRPSRLAWHPPGHHRQWHHYQCSCRPRQAGSESARRRQRPILVARPNDAPDDQSNRQSLGVSREKEKTCRPYCCDHHAAKRLSAWKFTLHVILHVIPHQAHQSPEIKKRRYCRNQQSRSHRPSQSAQAPNEPRIKRIENYSRRQIISTLGDPQIPEGVETLPNPKQRIMPTTRRRQILGEHIAVNQTRIRMQKNRRNRCNARIHYAQRHRDR